MRIGFIGLGHMGAGMAGNLLAAGHEVLVFNRSPGKADHLVAQGAVRAATIREACQADAVFSMVADDQAATSLVEGAEGILATLPAGATHISSSTISVDLSRRLADRHRTLGQTYLASPVFGRPEAAAAAKLFVVCAGDADVFEKAKPLLDAIGQHTFYVGRTPETANAIKLGGNFLICSVMEALGESMALVSKLGVPPDTFLEILTSSLFDAPIYHTYGGLIARREFRPARFAARLGTKDIRLLLEAAGEARVPMPLASLIHDRQLRILATEGDDIDWSALGGLAFQDAGIADPRA
jgi:3-hydroxyisobutyrate dehydrogenase-like beta-hydroxyacid dehydrogenase